MADVQTGEISPWWRGAVIYQVYPRSFADANGDGVGDLKGIIGKLDYIASLGVDGVWISPFFVSPMKDFGYDVNDYRDVDPLFGTLADFDTLLASAHDLGLKVIIDQVWSHTSDQHAWFKESAASREGPKSDWYVWADAKDDGSPPNNWQAAFGGPSWTWSAQRRQYYLHNFLREQPDLNYWSPEVQDEILDVARFWLDRGVDGFRLDVINFIFHDQQLRDNPAILRNGAALMPTRFQAHSFDRSRPEALAFLARLRALMDAYPGRMTLGEVVDEPALPRQIEYTATPERLHTAYSFHLLQARKGDVALFAEALRAWDGAPGWPSWSLGNHDTARFATRLSPTGDVRQVRILMAVLMCLRGTIFLYQGEELGLPQAHVPFEQLRDPYAINAYVGGSGRDGARTPMPWTAEGPSAGFSAIAETWLPVGDAHRHLAVARQEAQAASMLHFTRDLIALRGQFAALRVGTAELLPYPQGALAFSRTQGGQTLLCLFELDGQDASIGVPQASTLVKGFSGNEILIVGEVHLPAYGGVILNIADG